MSPKKAVFTDIDKTIIKGNSINLLVKHTYNKNLFAKSLIFKTAFWHFLYKINYIKDFTKIVDQASEILHEMLNGMTAEEIQILLDETYLKEIKPRFFPDFIELIHDFHKKGYEIYYISSTITPLANFVKEYFGFGKVVATNLEQINGFYTGKIIGKVCYGEEKLIRIEQIEKEDNLDLSQSYAYSDHISDVPMLEKVGHPVVINPGRRLKKIANSKGWEIKKNKR